MPASTSHTTVISSQQSGSSIHEILLLILLADTPVEPVLRKHGDYHDIFASLFRRALEAHPSPEGRAVTLTVQSYDVVNEPYEYPSEEELSKASGLLITGSAASAYEDKPWILRLVDFTASLPKRYPMLKLVGICYGHQIIARASGGKVEKNDKGWELGVRSVKLSEAGKKFLLPRSDSSSETIAIHQVHQDHVPELPDGFVNLGSTPVSPIQGMVAPATAESLDQVRIWTVQGHPEFSPDVVTDIINVREAKGIISSEFAEQSRVNAALHDDGIWLGSVVLRMIGA